MPTFDVLTKVLFTPKQWLNYYRNIWQRNMMGSMVDVMHDGGKPAGDSTIDNVTDDVGRAVVDEKTGEIVKKTFGERLEERKSNVKRCAGVIAAIDKLLALSEDELIKHMASDGDFLKAIEPAAPAAAATEVSFTVAPGKSLAIGDKTYTENTTVDLDPEAEETKAWLSAGLIAPTTAGI